MFPRKKKKRKERKHRLLVVKSLLVHLMKNKLMINQLKTLVNTKFHGPGQVHVI